MSTSPRPLAQRRFCRRGRWYSGGVSRLVAASPRPTAISREASSLICFPSWHSHNAQVWSPALVPRDRHQGVWFAPGEAANFSQLFWSPALVLLGPTLGWGAGEGRHFFSFSFTHPPCRFAAILAVWAFAEVGRERGGGGGGGPWRCCY